MQGHRHDGAALKRFGAATATAGLLLGLLAGGAGASRASEKALAKKALLVLSDLPKGWTSTKTSGTSGGAFPGAAQLASCVGVPASVITAKLPTADSPSFSSSDQSLAVDDSVTVFPSGGSARAQFGALTSAKTPSCMAALLNGPQRAQLQKAAGTGTTVGTISVVKAPASDFAPHVAGFTVTVPISSGGDSVSVRTTEVFLVKDKETHEIRMTSYKATFPVSLYKHLTAAAARRL